MSDTPQPTCDARQAVEFLKLIQPVGPWALCALSHDDESKADARFTPEQSAECAAWIAEQNAQRRSIYYRAAAIRPDVSPLYAKKPDVIGVRFAWVDIDPIKSGNRDDERRIILEMLTSKLPEGTPAPTWIVDSGNGFQAGWMFAAPQRIGDGDGKLSLKTFESINNWLVFKFAGNARERADNRRSLLIRRQRHRSWSSLGDR